MFHLFISYNSFLISKHIHFFAAINLHSQASSVTLFTGVNFSEWSEQVTFHLGALDLDLALLEDRPTDLNDDSTEAQKSHHKAWIRSNRPCLNFMWMKIA